VCVCVCLFVCFFFFFFSSLHVLSLSVPVLILSLSLSPSLTFSYILDPNVSMVLQCGLPSSRSQYIHRLGRTARAGKRGQGYLILGDFEYGAACKELKGLPIKVLPLSGSLTRESAELLEVSSHISPSVRGMAYAAWLGYYNSHLKKLRWDKTTCVQSANQFSREVLSLEEPPALMARTVGKMGLKGIPGIRVERGAGGGGRGGGRGGRGGGGRGGRGGGSFSGRGGFRR
jgi:ATP-dependent RNA helicase MSS116, mitochondrial